MICSSGCNSIAPSSTRAMNRSPTHANIAVSICCMAIRAFCQLPCFSKLGPLRLRWLFRQFVEKEKIPWIDPWLRAQDLEFHQVDAARSLGLALSDTPEAWELTAADIQYATRMPPINTRANLRSYIMHQLKTHPIRYFVDWEIIDAEGGNSLNLLN